MKERIFNFAMGCLVFFGIFALGMGCESLRHPAEKANAQISSPSYTCGQVSPCAQYVIQITNQRGFGKYQVFQVPGPALDTSSLTFVTGSSSGVSVQVLEPNQTDTTTISLSEP